MNIFQTTLTNLFVISLLALTVNQSIFAQPKTGQYMIYNGYGDFLACSSEEVRDEDSNEYLGNWAQWVNSSCLEEFTKNSWVIYFNLKKLENEKYIITNHDEHFLTFRPQDRKNEENTVGHGYGVLWAKPQYLDELGQKDAPLFLHQQEQGNFLIKNGTGDFIARAGKPSELGRRAQWARKIYEDKFDEKFPGAHKLILCKQASKDYEGIIRSKDELIRKLTIVGTIASGALITGTALSLVTNVDDIVSLSKAGMYVCFGMAALSTSDGVKSFLSNCKDGIGLVKTECKAVVVGAMPNAFNALGIVSPGAVKPQGGIINL